MGLFTQRTYRIIPTLRISDEQLNVTPSFFTFDSSKIKVGAMPQGYIGLPVEFPSKFTCYCPFNKF
jgi:hypothetical protein